MSLSVGNQVSGPVGRPLSISVLLAIYNTRRARVVISRSRPPRLFSLYPPLHRPSPPAATLHFLFLAVYLANLSFSVDLSRPLLAKAW